MPYILERRQNGKEIVTRLNDNQGRILYESVRKGEIPSFVEVNGEMVKNDTIVTVSIETSWWVSDENAQRSRGKQRCRHCFVITTFGEKCGCLSSGLERVGFLEESSPAMQSIDKAQLRQGMIRALKAALQNPNVNLQSPFVIGFMRRHGVTEGELMITT